MMSRAIPVQKPADLALSLGICKALFDIVCPSSILPALRRWKIDEFILPAERVVLGPASVTPCFPSGTPSSGSVSFLSGDIKSFLFPLSRNLALSPKDQSAFATDTEPVWS